MEVSELREKDEGEAGFSDALGPGGNLGTTTESTDILGGSKRSGNDGRKDGMDMTGTGRGEEREEEEDEEEDENEKTTEKEEEEGVKPVDISGQGLTMIPVALFKRVDITVLNLSSNNIRSLPVDIVKLTQLRHLDVSRNGLRCAHAKDTSSLPPEMETMPCLEELNLSECNLMHIPPTVWRLPQLRRLDISRNKVRELPGEFGCMSQLRYLNAQQTGLDTLPPEIVCCEELETLLLFGNRITSLPDTMRELKRLTTLTINVSVFSESVDDYMDALLQRGQIMSEQVPAVLFQIPRLKFLDLGKCKLNNLPKKLNRGLEEIILNSNYFTEIPNSLFKLKNITQLEISSNHITSFPNEMVKLIGLKHLVARDNQLTEIDSAIGQMTNMVHLDLGANQIKEIPDHVRHLVNLEVLILDQNELVEIPDALCDLIGLSTLDLSSNKIAALPLRMHNLSGLKTAHTYEGLFKQGLWVNKNVITAPPESVWKCTEPQKIWDFLKKLRIRSVLNLQPLKVIVIGNHKSGKSTFLKSFLSGKASINLTREECEQEAILNPFQRSDLIYNLLKWTSENLVRYTFLNLGCHPICESVIPHFLDPQALYLITFDAGQYLDEGFQHQIGCWLRVIHTYSPEAVVKLVGVKSDLLVEEENSVPLADPSSDLTSRLEQELNQQQLDTSRRNSYLIENTLDALNPTLKPSQPESEANSSALSLRRASNLLELAPSCKTNRLEIQSNVSRKTSRNESDTGGAQGQTSVPSRRGSRLNSLGELMSMNQYRRSSKIDNENLMGTIPKIAPLPEEEPIDEAELERMREEAESELRVAILEDLELFKEDFNNQVSAWKSKVLAGAPTMGTELNLRIIPTISFVNSTCTLRGISELKAEMEHIAIDPELFPQNQVYIPPNWFIFCTSLKHTNNSNLSYQEWEVVKRCAKANGLKGEVLVKALNYFHSTGEVFWFSRHPVLKDYVFHRPRQLSQLLSCIFQDFDTFLDYSTNPVFNCLGHFSEEEFEEAKQLFDDFGEVSLPLVRCFLFQDRFSSDQLIHLLELLHLFLVGIYNPLPRVPEGNLFKQPILILPKFVRKTIPEDYLNQELWPNVTAADSSLLVEESCSLVFPLGRPLGIFEAILVRLHSEISYREDWCGMVYARARDTEILLQEEDRDSGGEYVLKMTLRHTNPTERLDLITWLKTEIITLSKKASGLVVCLDT